MKKYRFNRESKSFDKESLSAGMVILTVLKYCLYGIAAAAVMYLLFALIFSVRRAFRWRTSISSRNMTR